MDTRNVANVIFRVKDYSHLNQFLQLKYEIQDYRLDVRSMQSSQQEILIRILC